MAGAEEARGVTVLGRTEANDILRRAVRAREEPLQLCSLDLHRQSVLQARDPRSAAVVANQVRGSWREHLEGSPEARS